MGEGEGGRVSAGGGSGAGQGGISCHSPEPPCSIPGLLMCSAGGGCWACETGLHPRKREQESLTVNKENSYRLVDVDVQGESGSGNIVVLLELGSEIGDCPWAVWSRGK